MMRISPVISTPANMSFKSNILKKELEAINPNKDQTDKVSTYLKGMAVAGAALIGIGILKHNHINPLAPVKNLAGKIAEKYSNRPIPDPIVVKLNGRRDASAVRQYRAAIAQKKLTSLQNKMLEGQLYDKKPEAFSRIIENSKKLTREILIDL